MTRTLPLASREIQNPPPPRLPASGHVTARANETATAASAALPPCLRISIPICAAVSSAAATAPPTPCCTCGPAAERGRASRKRIAPIRLIAPFSQVRKETVQGQLQSHDRVIG